MPDLIAPEKTPSLNKRKVVRLPGLVLAVAIALASCATVAPEATAPPTKIPVTVYAPPIVAALAEVAATATNPPATPTSAVAPTPWVDLPIATDTPSIQQDIVPATPSQPEARPLADANYVNVRSAPNTQASVVARVLTGGFARVVGRIAAGDWYAVEYATGAIGYVKASAAIIAGDVSQLPAMDSAKSVSVAVAPAISVAVAPAIAPAPAPAPASAAVSPSGCPTTSGNTYELIPRDSPPADRPDKLHGDLNLALRGYATTSESSGLASYNGATDSDAPQFSGLFGRMGTPTMAYRVNIWRFESDQCGGAAHGCRGSVDNTWPVTLLGLAASPGEVIAIPSRNAPIYTNAQAMVLFADDRRITVGYTRQDTIASGYAVYIENVCVDPNLLALYRAQVGPDGYRSSGALPSLRNGQSLGTAAGGEVIVGIRDSASWLDPRSRKDWWQR